MSSENPKTYLGDGVYAEFDGHGFIITTSNGIETTNTIYLEPEVLQAFVNWGEKVTAHL
jgi:hypothetical protein